MPTLFQLKEGLVKAQGQGNEEHVNVLSEAIREHPTYQKQGQEDLSKGFKALSGDERKQAIHKSTAQALGIKPSDLDSDRGMGGIGRVQFKAQPTQEEKLSYLEKTYGRENLNVANIGGEDQFLYRDEAETGGKWRRVDEEGVSLADFTSDILPEVLPTLGAVGGGLGGLAVGGIPGSIAGAAAGGALARGAQDVATRAVSGEEQDFGEMLPRLGKEALIGAGIDAVTLGTGRLFSKLGGKGVQAGTKGATGELVGAAERLADEGFATRLAPAQRTSVEAGEKFTTAISDRTSSRAANLAAANRDTMGEFQEVVTGGVSSGDAFRAASDRVSTKLSGLTEGIESMNKAGQKGIDDAIEAEFAAMTKPRLNKDASGQAWKDSTLDPAVTEIERVNRKNFEDFYADAVAQNVQVDNKIIKQAIKKGLARFENLSSAEVNKIVKQLSPAKREVIKVGDKPMLDQFGKEMLAPEKASTQSLKGFKEFKDKVNDVVSSSKVAGFGTQERVAMQVAKELDNLMGEELAKHPQLAAQFKQANDFYTDQLLGTKRGAVGSATKQVLADDALTNTQVVDKIMSDPQHVREILKTVEDAGMDSAPIRAQMEDAFIASIGLESGVTGSRGITYNREVADELFGKRGSDGIDRINKMLKQRNVKFAKLDEESVREALSGLSEKARQEAAKKVAARAKAQQESRKILDSKLMKDMAQGRYNDSEEFGKAMLGSTTGEIDKAFRGIDKSLHGGLKQDFTNELFRRTNKGAQVTSEGIPLWNPETMGDLLSSSAPQIKKVLGETTYNKLKDANRVLKANVSRSKTGADQLKARASFSGGVPHLFVVGDLFTNVQERFWGWAQGSENGLLNRLLTGVSKGDLDKRMETIVPLMISSRKGAEALNRTSDQDPELRAKMSGLSAQ